MKIENESTFLMKKVTILRSSMKERKKIFEREQNYYVGTTEIQVQ